MTSSRTPLRSAAALLLLAAVGGADPVRVSSANPRYFERDGKLLVLVTSDHHYGAVIDADFDFVPFLEYLGSAGMNLTRIYPGGMFEPTDKYVAGNPLGPRVAPPVHRDARWTGCAGAPGGACLGAVLSRPAGAGRGHARGGRARAPCLAPSSNCCSRPSAWCVTGCSGRPGPTTSSVPCAGRAGVPCARPGASGAVNPSPISVPAGCVVNGRRRCGSSARACGSTAALARRCTR